MMRLPAAAYDPPTPKQTRAIAALLSGATQTEAAKAAGVDEKTLRRWQSQAGFAVHLREASADAIRQAAHALAGASGEAVETLRALMAEGNPPSVRLSAASRILDALGPTRDLVVTEERLQALEDSIR